ncbi:MAG: hypothetical protein IPJ47_15535 [Anaerolineales bacterium]|nr:hypothetical protein [Anaerolineales bacterium]
MPAAETLDAILSGENYILEMAEDGIQTLEKVQTLRPDLILLDDDAWHGRF